MREEIQGLLRLTQELKGDATALVRAIRAEREREREWERGPPHGAGRRHGDARRGCAAPETARGRRPWQTTSDATTGSGPRRSWWRWSCSRRGAYWPDGGRSGGCAGSRYGPR
jgi:hypothetical protein